MQLGRVRALITAGGQPLGAALMDQMPKLGAIVCYGTGYDGVDLAAGDAARHRRRQQSRRPMRPRSPTWR